jgi:hypothetical protein
MKRVYALLRVLGLALTLLTVTVAITAKRAEARITEVLHGFGEQLAQLHELSSHSVPRKLFVNGLELGVVSASTTLPVGEALNRFQSLCHGVSELNVPAAVRQKLEASSSLEHLKKATVLREETDHEGFVACLDTQEPIDGAALLGRLQAFRRTQDLKSLGQLRYALVRRRGDTTTLIVFWTEGEAILTEQFKKGQDAPGRDLSDVPRPADAKRILSAFEQGQPYGLALYRIEGKHVADVRDAYEAALRQAGWLLEKDSPGGIVRASKGERVLVVRAKAGRGGQVLVSLIDAA